MKFSLAAGLFVLAAVASAQDLSPAKPTLALHLDPGKLHKGLPVEFTFELVNISDHDVHVPKPGVDCVSSEDGYIWLELRFTPAKPNFSGSGFGCAAGITDLSPILRRAQDWQVLHPGEAMRQTVRHNELNYDGKGAGRYEFWAEYHPPAINSQDQGALRDAAIDFPREDLKTSRLIYTKR